MVATAGSVTDGQPPVLVLGASGMIGRYLVPRLAVAGAPVLAVSRRPPEAYSPGVTWIQHDLGTGAMSSEAGVLVSVGPLRYAVAQVNACERLGRVVALSSASVLFKQQSPDRRERHTIQALAAAEMELADLCGARGIALTIFRPCMIYGGGDDANVTRLKALVMRLPVVPVAGRGLRQPVHADDLAKVIVAALEKADAATGVYALGGGETLDYVQMLRRIATARGRGVRILRVPATLLAAGLGVAHLAGRLRDVHGAMLRRQAQDLVVDDQPAREVLGWAPRPFRP